jgi:hypothetical protein
MIKNITRLILITLFAYFVFDYSVAIDVEQFYKDLKRFNLNINPNLNQTYIFISLVIAFITLFFIYIFRPFVEIYLLHFLKYNFYFLINLISISTIFIIFRIYGYSRLALLVYLVFSTTSLYLSDKIKNK